MKNPAALIYLACVVATACGPAVAADARRMLIDDFAYADSASARSAWVPSEAAGDPAPERDETGTFLQLPARFSEGTLRAVWDRAVQLDLTDYERIVFRFRISDRSLVRMVSLYLNSGGTGWYANIWVGPITGDGWQTVVVPKTTFGAEGTCPGWHDIRAVRVSVWQARPGQVTCAIGDLRAEGGGGPENLLMNGSFEVCTTERLPDGWGTGHWGLTVERWICDTEQWRRRWGADDRVSHSGRRSLRMDSTGEPNEGLQLSSNWVGVDAAQAYTLSAWLRADREGMGAILYCGQAASEELKVGRVWQRYVLSAPPGKSPAICTIAAVGRGTLWVDDVQLERADAPSPWQAAPGDAALTGLALHRAPPPFKPYPLQPLPQRTTVRIDEHRRLLVNGEPFIPFANGFELTATPEIMRDTALAGFNSICQRLRPQPVEQLREQMDAAAALGLMVIPWIGQEVPLEMLREWIVALRDHPALLAWYVYDEPSSITPEVQAKYDAARELDPGHPAYINYILYPRDQLGDIASLDYYPIPNNPPLTMAGEADTLEASASKAGKPSWIWLQSMGNAYYIPREPTGPEAECMAYLTLIHGVRGIKYFVHKPLSGEQWDTLAQLAREVRVLTPALSSVEPAPRVRARPGSLHVLVRRHGGATYIIAVNDSPLPVRGAIRLLDTPDGIGPAEVLFESRTAPLARGWLRDSFGGYQRHVYLLR